MPGSEFIPFYSTLISLCSITLACRKAEFRGYLRDAPSRFNSYMRFAAKWFYLFSTLAFRLLAWLAIATFFERFTLIPILLVGAANFAILLKQQRSIKVDPALQAVYSVFYPISHFKSPCDPQISIQTSWCLTSSMCAVGNVILTVTLFVVQWDYQTNTQNYKSALIPFPFEFAIYISVLGVVSLTSLAATYYATFEPPKMISGSFAQISILMFTCKMFLLSICCAALDCHILYFEMSYCVKMLEDFHESCHFT